jgi:serine/threonine-protein kinase
MYGAIAYGKSSLRYGYSFDAGSRYDAESRALSECGAADCAVVVWFVNACGALARSTHGQIGWGWAATREQAESIALGYCEKESGGRYPCSVLVWACTSR